jgi:CheY-like chemotaxis protein
MSTLPMFYFPTTTIWVDDNNNFLKAAEEILGSNQLKTFNDPQACLSFFTSYQSIFSKIPFLHGCIDNDYYGSVNHSPVDFNVPALQQIKDHSERQNEISVVIVDYKMPGMNGIELCRELKNSPIKKILLTGEANAKEAITAFNENIIDRFIPKNSTSLVNDVRTHLNNLNLQYFCERTYGLLQHLEADSKLPLTDPSFIDFFNHWRQAHAIKEYYLIDKNGSLHVTNEKNQSYYFILHTDKSLNSFITLYQDEIPDMMAAIKNREKIPFFGVGREGWEFETKEWSNYFYEPQVLAGRENYYWVSIKA